MAKRLTKEALKAIRSNSDLHKAVSDELGIIPGSMPETIRRNGNNLNQFHIVEMVAKHMGIATEDAVEEYEPETATA